MIVATRTNDLVILMPIWSEYLTGILITFLSPCLLSYGCARRRSPLNCRGMQLLRNMAVQHQPLTTPDAVTGYPSCLILLPSAA